MRSILRLDHTTTGRCDYNDAISSKVAIGHYQISLEMATDDEKLNLILKKGPQYNLTSEELTFLAFSFLPTNSDATSLRPKAYVVLSVIFQEARRRENKRTNPDDAIVRTFSSVVDQLFAETEERSLLAGACFLTALFQVDPLAASSIFTKDGLLEGVVDSIDLSPSSSLSQEIARLLGQACGHKSCRRILTPQVVRWLEFKSRQTTDLVLQCAASVALIKLSKGATSDSPEDETLEVGISETSNLAKSLTEIIASGKGSTCVEAVEGLAYLTVEPALKESFASNPSFLKQLFALMPTKKSVAPKWETSPAMIYGVSVIICNLSSFRPHLTEEEKQMEKLKRMTKRGKGFPADEDKANLLDNDEHVKARIRSLISCGVLPVFSAAITATDSKGVRLNVGKSLLCMVEEKDNRGTVLQAGGAKVLQTIIKQSPFGESHNAKEIRDVDASELLPIQALAKLSITSSPIQVFGPNIGAIYDAIRPLSVLLQYPSSNLLQRFEAMMALTNLASHSPDVAARITKVDGIVDKAELLLLDGHNLVRRASVELICNLIVGSDEAFDRYTTGDRSSASKIHIFLALSDVDDLPTRLAASGALATLSAAPSTCKTLIDLQFESHRFFTVMKQLINPFTPPDNQKNEQSAEVGLVIRGVVCVTNVFKSIKSSAVREQISKEGTESGLLQALIHLAKGESASKDPSAMHQAVEALSALAG